MDRYRALALENLKLAHPKRLARLRTSGQLEAHLDQIEEEATEMYWSLSRQMRREQFNEKEPDHLKRAQALMQIHLVADEVVRAEVVQLPPDADEEEGPNGAEDERTRNRHGGEPSSPTVCAPTGLHSSRSSNGAGESSASCPAPA